MSALSDPDNVQLWVVDETPATSAPLTDEDVYAILTGRRSVVAAAPPVEDMPDGDDDSDVDIADEQMGGMIALIPTDEDAQRLVLEGGEPAEELHMTLVYLGEAAMWDLGRQSRLIEAVQEFAQNVDYVVGNVFGAAQWNPKGKNPAIVLNVGDESMTDCMAELQEDMCDLAQAACFGELAEQHEPWVPHICVAYSNDATLLVRALTLTGPTTFDRIRVAFAGQSVDIPLYAPPTQEVTMTGETIELAADAPPVTGSEAPVGDTNLPATTPGPYTGAGTPWWGALVVEGVETGDGRLFSEGSLTWPQPPLSLRWQREDLGGHTGAVVSGRIDDVWRLPSNPNVIMGKGVFDDVGVDGAEALRQVGGGFLKGVSVDVDSVKDADVELVFPPGDGADALGDMFAEPELTIFHAGRIRGATQCALPAYVEAAISLGDVPVEMSSMPTASPAPSGGYSLNSYSILWPHRCGANTDINRCATGIGATLTAQTGPDGRSWTMAERRGLYEHLAAHVHQAGLTPQAFSDSSLSEEVQALYASAGDTEQLTPPPLEAFVNPGFDEPTGLHVVQADGYQIVRGHAALWASCHLSFPNACVTPPHEDEHVYYRLGEVVTASGERVAVGPITLGTGHAAVVGLDPRKVAEHYDNTGSCVALVASGNDDHGIWVSGVIKPGTPAGRVMELAGAKLSGDWRRIGGKLRLVAMLAVNVPGFPVPRLNTQVRNGVQTSLVAAGMLPDSELLHRSKDREAIRMMAAKVAKRIGRDPQTRAAELRTRVFGGG